MDNQSCIFHLLNQAAKNSTKYWHKQVAKYGLTAVQAKVLIFLQDLQTPTCQQLAEHCGLEAASITGIVDRLITMSFLTRIADTEDRRVNRIDFTTEGRALSLQLKKLQSPANNQFLSKLNTDQQQQLKTILNMLSE